MGHPQDLAGFGEEIQDYKFVNWLDWFIHVRSPFEAYKAQPTYILSEWMVITVAMISLCHAFYVGGRWKYHWLGILVHGLTTEMVAFAMPDIDNYWHSQTSIMLLGRRLPLHITMLYPVFMYNAAYMVAHLKLPRWAEPMAAGLVEVLVDIPYDITAVKFVHWTWHDTDPNIYDRHYWVPWNSYYFHMTFGTAFTFALHFFRRRITGTDDKGVVSTPGKEILCAVLAGLCGMPGGVLQFIFLYHPLHDTYGIHTENCAIIIISLYVLIVWTADRRAPMGSRKQPGETFHWSALIIAFNMIFHHGLYLWMVLFKNPEEEVSIGLHETPGNCSQTSDVYTAFGGVLKKKTYLCADDYDEKYFDFHCLPGGNPVGDGASWYTICGTPFENRAEYITTIGAICTFCAIIFYNMLFKSSRTLIYRNKKQKYN